MSDRSGLPTYREVAGPDRSGIGEQVAAQQARIARRLERVRHVVAVASGKGGVGKSFVAARLASALARGGWRTGLIDADVNGPTAPRLSGVTHPTPRVVEGAVQPVVTSDGVRLYSAAFLVAPGEPVRWHEPDGDGFVWRGTLEVGMLREMLADVAWGPLDILLVDLPPGPARLADLHRLVPALQGALAVTIPSPESHDAVRRALILARERAIPVLGVVENLTGNACTACGHVEEVFPGDAGARLAAEFGVPCLARLPFHPGPEALAELAAALRRTLEAA